MQLDGINVLNAKKSIWWGEINSLFISISVNRGLVLIVFAHTLY